jgi:hypothetical protein
MEDLVHNATRAQVKILETRARYFEDKASYLESKVDKLQDIVSTLLYTTEVSAKKILELEQYVITRNEHGTITKKGQ